MHGHADLCGWRDGYFAGEEGIEVYFLGVFRDDRSVGCRVSGILKTGEGEIDGGGVESVAGSLCISLHRDGVADNGCHVLFHEVIQRFL